MQVGLCPPRHFIRHRGPLKNPRVFHSHKMAEWSCGAPVRMSLPRILGHDPQVGGPCTLGTNASVLMTCITLRNSNQYYPLPRGQVIELL